MRWYLWVTLVQIGFTASLQTPRKGILFMEHLTVLIWPLLVVTFFLVYRGPIRRLFNSLVRRIERGDEVRLSRWITLGRSTGPLKAPATEGCVTDDHVALIHRSWRVADRDSEFGGQKMYQIHVILFGEKAALDRVEYVLYRLDPSYPNPVHCGGPRQTGFELKELANGYSLIRANVKIKEQEEIIYLSRFIDLTDESRQGPVSAVSCVGVGSGSMRWSEEELKRLELGVVGAFARGCHDAGIAQFCLLSAVGSTARSRFRYVRVMGMKEDTVRKIGFTRLAIFRPGIIAGNAHTPAWIGLLGRLVPGPFGNIDQRILGRSIAAEIALHSREAGEVIRENAAMKKLATEF